MVHAVSPSPGFDHAGKPETSSREKRRVHRCRNLPFFTPSPSHRSVLIVYEVGFGFILRLPPVMVTFTKRRVYTTRFFARPLGTFFFSCGSTCASDAH